jgi:hypothetical protein
MKIALSVILISLISHSASANEQFYKWAFGQYKAKDTDIIEKSIVGKIDNQTYLVLIAKMPNDNQMKFVVYDESTINKPINIAIGELSESPPWSYNVEIKKNSIFLTSGYCHHGCHEYRYQFKKINNTFRLVGADSQFDTIAVYFDGANAMAACNKMNDEGGRNMCAEAEVSSGNSYNLLNSTSICWFDNTSKNKLFSPRGSQQKIISQKANLPLMDGFNPENTTLPKTCYFDYNKKWHVIEASPNK